MEQWIARFVKPIALATICFFSLLYLTKSIPIATIVATIPLLLGWLAIMQSFAYGVAAFMFLAAVALAVIPSNIKDTVKLHSEKAIARVSNEVKSRN